MQIGARTEVGHVRRRNEDSLRVDEQHRVFAVADGLGGHPAGHVASRLAVDAIASALTGEALQKGDEVGEVLSEALQAAHRAVLEGAEEDPSRRGMGTTAVLAHVSEDERELWVGHVGDSRAYLMRSGELRQVTTDHSSAGWYGGRNITQAVGTWGDVSPEVVHLELQQGDRILLCTDGLTDMVHASQIARLLDGDGPAERLCDQLVEEALAEGGRDNVTVIVVAVQGLKMAPAGSGTGSVSCLAASRGPVGSGPAPPRPGPRRSTNP